MKNQNETNNMLASFLLGAIAGVAAVVLLDKDMREKVEDTLSDVKAKGEDELDRAKDQFKRIKDKGHDEIEAKLAKIQDLIDEIKSNK